MTCANCHRSTCPMLAPEHKGIGAPTCVQLDCERAKSAALESQLASVATERNELREILDDINLALDAGDSEWRATESTVECVTRVRSELAAERARANAEAANGAMLREALIHLRAMFRWGSAPDLLTDEDREIVRRGRCLDGRETLRDVIDPVLAGFARRAIADAPSEVPPAPAFPPEAMEAAREALRLDGEATPGPWEVAGPFPTVTVGIGDGERDEETNYREFMPLLTMADEGTADEDHDARFIIRSRTLIVVLARAILATAPATEEKPE